MSNVTHPPADLNAAEVSQLHLLPDDALLTTDEAATVLRLRATTLNWRRCHGGGPKFVRVGTKSIRYRMGDLRAYAKGA